MASPGRVSLKAAAVFAPRELWHTFAHKLTRVSSVVFGNSNVIVCHDTLVCAIRSSSNSVSDNCAAKRRVASR
ncbi:hypothetical protein J6590_039104 [Homalodisca vitripennis]|nr:hypothetical protein J6590_039104 [Homalodisca vitripennis]